MLPGGPLTEQDYTVLEHSGIGRELADTALLRRVTSHEGNAIVGRSGAGDYAGIIFPYLWPGEPGIREFRLRRDHPDIEYRDGKPREKAKYLAPPGRGILLYFPPGTPAEWLSDVALPVMITGGEKKVLGLWCLAHHQTERPRWLSVGLSGVWNWRGTIGKVAGPNGERLDEKGPIPDLSRIVWAGRRVYICFDANVQTNDSVRAAREQLAAELRSRGAEVWFIDLPDVAGVNGVDDLLGIWGPERTLELFQTAREYRVDLTRYPLTDSGNAERFLALHGGTGRGLTWWTRSCARRWKNSRGNRKVLPA